MMIDNEAAVLWITVQLQPGKYDVEMSARAAVIPRTNLSELTFR
jgi:hypothetical protein